MGQEKVGVLQGVSKGKKSYLEGKIQRWLFVHSVNFPVKLFWAGKSTNEKN